MRWASRSVVRCDWNEKDQGYVIDLATCNNNGTLAALLSTDAVKLFAVRCGRERKEGGAGRG